MSHTNDRFGILKQNEIFMACNRSYHTDDQQEPFSQPIDQLTCHLFYQHVYQVDKNFPIMSKEESLSKKSEF